jgi:HPt (histidine-containing phosphotransfer) domain-containing protein
MVEHWGYLSQAAPDQEPETEEAAPDIHTALDMMHALPRFGNDQEFFLSLLRDFIYSIPEKLSIMQSAVEQNDLPALSRQAHNLKGVAANFSAMELSYACHRLDQAGKGEDRELIQQLLSDINAIVERLNASADELLKNQEELSN